MIAIHNLRKTYSKTLVLDGISLNIARGEMHGLLGISGAGKSTLLRCINGLEPYDSGSILVEGQEVGQLKGNALKNFRKTTNMIFQDFALLQRKSVLDNVLLPMKCWGYTAKYMHDKAMELLDMVGLADKATVFPSELSGGQKQRVAIARTLSLEPQIILCDEATSALDPSTAESILNLLQKINEEFNITMVIVTHQMSVVKKVCSRLSIMEHGHIVLTDSVASVFTNRPAALERLAGTPMFLVPTGQTCFAISLNTEQLGRPILSELSVATSVRYTILNAQTDDYGSGKIGHFHIAVDTASKQKVWDYLSLHTLDFTVHNEANFTTSGEKHV